MKAVQRFTYGREEVLSINDIEKPTPKEGELLIRVHATTVNRTDCGVITGEPLIFRLFVGFPKPKHATLGTDFVGEVVALGDNCSKFKVGDRVMGFCDEGTPSQAEFLAFSEQKGVALIPEGVEYQTAVASLEAAHYAYNFITKVNLKKGDKVMVNGGTGGIGSAAIQFLKHFGCHVTATCRCEHFERLKELGADDVIDYELDDFTEQEKKFPFVFDAVGKSTFGKCKNILTERGVYISSELGPYAQNPFLAIFSLAFGKQKVKFPVPVNIPRSLAFISERLQDGSFTPLIDKTYKIEDIKEAYRYVLSGQKVGNVVVEIDG
jgi:NADPH:quinone reductase-like Zn-dependent oxidoreductase